MNADAYYRPSESGRLDDEWEIEPGVWKRFGDMTREDIEKVKARYEALRDRQDEGA